MHAGSAKISSCAPKIPLSSCLSAKNSLKTRKTAGMILAAGKVILLPKGPVMSRRMTVKKYSPSFYHRLLLWGVLLFGATLLLLNALMIMNTESGLY